MRSRTFKSSTPFIVAFGLGLFASAGVDAQNLYWNAAGTPVDSFELTDGPIPDAQPGDQVFTASNVCDSSTVRATFGNPDGVADPGEPFVGLRAIRAYTADAIATQETRYVLLVGGDSYDYLDHLDIGSVSFIPTFYMPTHTVVSFAPSDAALADADLDGSPDAAIGRFPVRTLEELELMIDKTLAYSAASGDAVFAADAHDGANSFSDISDQLAATLSRMSVRTAYPDDTGLAGARAELLAALDSGPALTHFFGHSSPSSWTFSGLLGSGDPETLGNAGDPTVALQWGCWGGYHSTPRFDTLSHRLLLSGRQGAAAVVGASTLTEVASDRALAEKVYRYLSVPGTRLGDALQQAKSELGASHRDVLLGMTLLGDPALAID